MITLEEEIMKLDLIASDAFEGRNTNEFRQLAEWLRELKALKENDDVKDVFKGCNTCKYVSLEPDDFPCDRCCHRYINQYVYDDKREVNTDDT